MCSVLCESVLVLEWSKSWGVAGVKTASVRVRGAQILPAAPLAVRRTYLVVVFGGADASFCLQARVLAVVAPPAPAAQSASGVGALL